jgi:hypothetical protein
MKARLFKLNSSSFILPSFACIIVLSTCVLFSAIEARAQQGVGTRKAGDARVKALLEQIGYKYELTVDGDFKLVPITTDNGRSQLAYIISRTQQYGTLEIREVMSPAYSSTGPLPAVVANRLLRENSEVKLGAWRVEPHANGQKSLALFAVQVAAGCDAETLRLAIKSVILVADRMEKELTATDDY